MKIIISHDIDHFYWSDHFFKDLFIPKYIIKNTLFFFKGQIPFSLYLSRLKAFSSNRFSRLLELVDFNEKNEVPAAYFMGVRNALNLSYSESTAASIATFLREKSCPLYLHGIAYDELEKMREEKEILQKIISGKVDGIRMHYLRNSSETIENISKLNYSFDSTIYKLENPYFIGDTIEFPVSMMEVYMLQYSETDFKKIQVLTEERIDNGFKAGLKYFTVIFHDHHYSESFPLHKKWYEWLIGYLKHRNYQFITFEGAMAEIRLIK